MKTMTYYLLFTVLVMLWLYQKDIITEKSFKRLWAINNCTKLDTCGTMNDPENYNFIAIICNRNPKRKMSVKHEQMRHVNVMLKSAAMLTRSYLRFNIVVDSDNMKNNIEAMVAKWPEEYRSHLVFSYHKLYYPPGYGKMRNMQQPCQTQVLFLPDMFHNLDAAIYLDTDIIFLTSPEELWEEFNKFNDIQLAAIAPDIYGKDRKHPVYPPTGINTGMILMNITRIRQYNVQGGWTSAMLRIYKNYKGRLPSGDQSILNIFFNQNYNLLYPIGCWWNFIYDHCRLIPKTCLSQMIRENRGVALLHGAGNMYFNNLDKMFKAVFQAFETHIMGDPVNKTLTSLKHLSASIKDGSKICDKNEDQFLMELSKYIHKM